ncbi:SAF domain-containing protein, partial [Bacillus sp. SIMBA_006]
GNVQFRRSLYFVRSMVKGERITSECVRSVRPGFGVAPKYLNDIIGSRVLNDVDINTPVSFSIISKDS